MTPRVPRMEPSTQPPLPAAAPPTRSAFFSFGAHLRFWLVAAGVLFVDLATKHWAFESLDPHEERSIISGWILFRRSLNDGAVFGSFSGQVELFILASVFALGFVIYLFARSAPGHWWFHLALALVLAGALGNLYDRAWMKADILRETRDGATGTVMIGTIIVQDADGVVLGDWPEGTHPRRFDFARGDLALVRQGVVRDFIKIVPRFPAWVPRLAGRDIWPWVFNIADSALVCGVIMLLVTTWPPHRRPAVEPGAP